MKAKPRRAAAPGRAPVGAVQGVVGGLGPHAAAEPVAIGSGRSFEDSGVPVERVPSVHTHRMSLLIKGGHVCTH